MIDDAHDEMAILTTAQGVIQSYEAEVHEAVLRKAKRNRHVRFRLLTSVTEQNVAIMRQDLDEIRMSGLSNIDGRHLEAEAGFLSCFVVKDEEALVFVTPPGVSITHGQEEAALWTNNSSVTHILKMFFQRLWRDAVDKDERLRQLDSKGPEYETIVFTDPRKTCERLYGTIASAKEEIVCVTGPGGVVGTLEFPFLELFQRGIRIRIMTAMDEGTQEQTRALAKYCLVRGVNSTPLRAVLIDRQHLFQLKSPPDGQTRNPVHQDSVFYTNDPTYTDGFYMMLNELWDMSQDLSAIFGESTGLHNVVLTV
jgi:hypothetical protein